MIVSGNNTFVIGIEPFPKNKRRGVMAEDSLLYLTILPPLLINDHSRSGTLSQNCGEIDDVRFDLGVQTY